MNETLDRWKSALINAGSGLAVVVLGVILEGGLSWPILLAAAIALGWGWWVSPLRRAQPHVDHADAGSAAGPHGVIVYWRPGCSYCQKLWRGLDADVRDELTWVNIMADAEGARFIRQFHDGEMVTPTAVTSGGRQVPATVESLAARVGG